MSSIILALQGSDIIDSVQFYHLEAASSLGNCYTIALHGGMEKPICWFL